jgi:hypothetical protein
VCNQGFNDTCNAFCGVGNVIGDDCFSDHNPFQHGMEGWYRDTNFWLRCRCSEVGERVTTPHK